MSPRLRTLSKSTQICARCSLRLRQRNGFREYHAKVPDRTFISFDGVDVVPFLQGLVTANITKSPQEPTIEGQTSWTKAIYTAFLNAQGRVLNDALIYPNLLEGGDLENKYLVELDSRSAQALLKHLKKHKLRSKFKMRLLDPEELETWSRRPDLRGESSYDLAPSGPMICAKDPRPGLHERLITPSGSSLSKSLHDTAAMPQSYTAHRISHGVAEGQDEIISEHALPQESNIDFFGGIDFRKGCYLGQELTIRTHHTGVVRKRIIPVRLSDMANNKREQSDISTQPPQNANISKAGSSKGRSAGKYLSGIGNIGLALCRLEMVSDIQLTDNTTTFDPEQKFKVSWEDEKTGEMQELQLEAIVPEWMREKLQRLPTQETEEDEEGEQVI